MPFPTKLKDPTTCRIFLSSPFRGMEKEREELVAKYFPQLTHLCNARGVSFVAVDMRWGITEEAADNAQVVNICLKEVERADIFVGLFGQRYGWHGKDDKMLQKNFDNVKDRYPWVNKTRDSGVTEVEYLRGHLNHPGEIPACFGFRDKRYDDEQKKTLIQAGKKTLAAKYSAESELAAKKIETLKQKILDTKKQCLAVHVDYPTPKDGARLVFETVLKHVAEVLLMNTEHLSKRDAELAEHDAFIASRSAIYIGGETYLAKLNKQLSIDASPPLIVIGPTGSGKSAMLSYWLSSLKGKAGSPVLLYHFVGSSADSTGIMFILNRLVAELELIVDRGKPTKELEETEELGHGMTTVDYGELVQQFLVLLEKVVSRKKQVILVIDGLGKVEKPSRTAKCLFWLPTVFPKGVFPVLSCRSNDAEIIQEITNRQYDVISIQPLDSKKREQMCLAILKQNSKELSAPQLKKIVESGQSKDPLFLKTVLSELCMFGSFRKLDEKIGSLVKTKSVSELFKHLLSRLEEDYCIKGSQDNLVEQVLGSLFLVRQGLSEKELISLFNIPSHAWSPLYFAIENFIINRAGLLQIEFDELKQAVAERYLSEQATRKKYTKRMVEYFQVLRKEFSANTSVTDPRTKRPAEELPWLLKSLGDTQTLIEVLTDLPIFGKLFLEKEYDLLELWKSTGCSGEKIAELYLSAVDMKVSLLLEHKDKENLTSAAELLLLTYLDALTYFMELGQFQTGREMVLKKRLHILEGVAQKLNESKRQKLLTAVRLKLACLYAEIQKYEEAEQLHKEVLRHRQRLVADAKQNVSATDLKDLAASYHGFAMLCSKTQHTEQAIDMFSKSLEIQRQNNNSIEVADSLHNLGVLYIKTRNFEKALELCKNSLEIYEQEYFGHLPPVIGIMMANIAVCCRNLGQIDEAEKMYRRSLEVTQKAYGRIHPNVAFILMNIATLETNQSKYQTAETHFREVVDIYEKCETLKEDADLCKTKEKLVFVLLKQERLKEAIIIFKDVFETLVKSQQMDNCWPTVHVHMAKIFLDMKEFDLARRITLVMLESSAKQDMNYVHLDVLDSMVPADKQEKRSEAYSLDYGFKVWPGSFPLFKHKAEKYLIPEGNSTKLIFLLDKVDSHAGLGQPLYDNAIVWCNQQNKTDMVLDVCKHAAKKFPEVDRYLMQACEILRDQEKFKDALPLAKQLANIKSENGEIIVYAGQIATRAEDFALARKYFETVLDKHWNNTELKNQAENALRMVDVLSKRGSVTQTKK